VAGVALDFKQSSTSGKCVQHEGFDATYPDDVLGVVGEIIALLWVNEDSQTAPVQGQPWDERGENLWFKSQLAAPHWAGPDGLLVDASHPQIELLRRTHSADACFRVSASK
tara:strand:- start:54 stop:386 length:333 start_codon:yes stop_codon:yes gene_type:complete